MGVFSGPHGGREPEDRSAVYVRQPVPMGDYATLDPSYSGTSIQSVAIRTTVDLIASMGSELPVDTYNGSGKQIRTPGNVLDPGGDGMGVEDWVYRLLTAWTLAGNNYGDVVEWAPNGTYIRTADLFHPDDVSVSMVGGSPKWRVGGREVTNVASFQHWRVNPVPGRLLGLSPIELHASTIGVTLSATRFGRQWFTEGSMPSALLVNKEDINPTVAQTAKERWVAATRGSREPVVLGNGWDYKPIQISPQESQFLETQQFSEAQCARMFGPGFAEILGFSSGGGSLTYTNVVDRRVDMLTFSMNRWLRRVDRVLSMFVPRPQRVRLNRDALLEATTLQRYQAFALALQNQWKTVNEVRADEDLDPVEWGDTPNEVLPQVFTPPQAQTGGN